MNVGILLFFVAIIILGILALIIIVKRTGGRASLDVDVYRSEWLTIEQEVDRNNEASYQLAIIKADKLLDRALRERGFGGATMGERMKSAQNSWSNANIVWSAHKLRNQIAHDTNVRINFDLTRRALAAFKRGLKDVGAI